MRTPSPRNEPRHALPGPGTWNVLDPARGLAAAPGREPRHDSRHDPRRDPRRDVAVVLGTRPEIVKLGALVRLLGDRVRVVDTGQHFDDELSGSLLGEFGLPEPALRLDGVGAAGRADQFSRIIAQLGRYFAADRPGAVVVQGDTNTAAAAALAAQFADVPVLHVEAGLRSYDRAMPEEINRMLVAVVADVHCAPTPLAARNLWVSGVDPRAVSITGNTVVEATLERLPQAAEAREVLESHGVEANRYILATIHRPENTDDPARLDAILTQLAKLPLPVVFPTHPRTRAAAQRHGLGPALDRLNPTRPLGHGAFMALAQHARLLISDSGGIQEECTVLKKPLIVIRNSTERPEAVDAGFAHLIQPGPQIAETAARLLGDPDLPRRLQHIPSPYGDGQASRRIAELALSLADG